MVDPLASPPRIGIVGSGFMARGVASVLKSSEFGFSCALTRRSLSSIKDFPFPDQLTNSQDQLIDESDLIVEVSGDPIHSTEVIFHAMEAGLPVVTLNSEFHVTTGSWFTDKGLLTEAEGDQPGSIAALRLEALAMGFKPLVYGNVKGFLNRAPSAEDMQYWSEKQGISVEQTTSFTDGTKLQIEQTLVANAFETDIYRRGLLGPETEDVESGAQYLAGVADLKGRAISDYVICSGCPGVFITAKHEEEQRRFLSYLKMGDGPFYTLIKPYHLCHLEVLKTVRSVLATGKILLNNGAVPRVSVAAVAKRRLSKDQVITKAIGGFDLRGEAIQFSECPEHAPIGLIRGARLLRSIEPGETLALSDLEIPDSRAYRIWKKLEAKAKASEAA